MADANFYTDLADWWLLFSPPQHYDEEAADLLQRLGLPRRSGEAAKGARAVWFEAFGAVGLRAQSSIDQWGRDIFIARRA